MRRSKAQLNAISRSYTNRNRKEAISNLKSIGVDYDEYCKRFGYKGSPCRLYSSLIGKEKKATENVEMMKKGL